MKTAKFKWHPGTGIAEAIVTNWPARKWKWMSLLSLGRFTLVVTRAEWGKESSLPSNIPLIAATYCRDLHMADKEEMGL